MYKSSSTTSRQYISTTFYDLESLAHDNWDNPRFLETISTELTHRSTDFAIKLQSKVVFRLDELAKDSFRFPSTEIGIGFGELNIEDWSQIGLLSAVGYVTGRNGRSTIERRSLLRDVFERSIPQNTNVENVIEWGFPRTSQRLRKLVHSLAAFVRQEKRNYRGDYSVSISEREADLAYLKKKYYDNTKFDWKYPVT